MLALLQAVQSVLSPSPTLQAAIAGAVRCEEFSAKHFLLRPGQVAQRLYFVEQGLLRGYALHAGQETTSWFMSEGDFIISVISFFTQQPSAEYIELLEPSVLYSISYADLQRLYRNFPEFNVVGRVLTERYYVLSEQRAYQLRTLSSAERYAQLTQEFPKLVQRLPLKLLASYLGMAPETLSRLRAKRN